MSDYVRFGPSAGGSRWSIKRKFPCSDSDLRANNRLWPISDECPDRVRMWSGHVRFVR